MNPHDHSLTPEPCEAFQRQISDAADAGALLTPDVQAHLRSCENCAVFAKIWFPQPPAVLAGPVVVSGDDRLRARILEAAARPEIIPFPVPAQRRTSWMAWCQRAAVCLALTGLAWWLLDPVPTRMKTPKAAVAEPSLSQSFAQLEGGTKHEQQILQTALVDGGQHVRSDVEWTLSALE